MLNAGLNDWTDNNFDILKFYRQNDLALANLTWITMDILIYSVSMEICGYIFLYALQTYDEKKTDEVGKSLENLKLSKSKRKSEKPWLCLTDSSVSIAVCYFYSAGNKLIDIVIV